MQGTRTGRGAALVAIIVGTFILVNLKTSSAAEQRVEWTNLVNVTLRGGNTLQKTGGCMGCDDATAVSRQMIRSGNGYVEFTVGEPYTFWMAGLSQSDGRNPRFDNIDFAFRFNANETADVLENGQYQGGDAGYVAGDRFRVALVDGRVEYLKNGRVVYESHQRPRYPLLLAVALGTTGATIRNARIDTSNRAFTDDSYYNESDRYARRSRAVGTSGQLVMVNPTERWTDTGMRVEAGDVIVMDAEGTIQMSDDPGDMATPTGSRTGRLAPDAPLPGQPAGMLLGRIDDAPAFAVGSQRSVRASSSGTLYLGVNDDFLDDNAGEYRVVITVLPQ